jgi:hypothetical protein
VQALKFDVEFHDAIATLCGNERLREDISRCRLLVRGLSRLAGMIENLHDALGNHLAIFVRSLRATQCSFLSTLGSVAYLVCMHLRQQRHETNMPSL